MMRRFWALDRLRALAVVLMIQGHVFTALLRPDAFSPAFNRAHGLLHGLTAPAFLFGAGLAFGLATYGRYDAHRRWGEPLRRRIGRYLSLLAIGYALQLPGASLWAAFHAQGAQLELVCRVGPLQLLAVTLGACQLAVLIAPTPRAHALGSALLGLIVLAASELVGRAILSERLPLLLGAFFDDAHGSQFPLFPWASFALFGVGAAGLLHTRAQAPSGGWLALIGGLAVAGGYLALASGLEPFHPHWFWRTSYSYFAFRLGLVVVALGCLSAGRESTTARAQDGLSALLARRSLAAYAAHLLLLYGTPFTPNLNYRFGLRLGLLQTSLTCALIFAGTLAVVLFWDWLERERKLGARFQRAGIVVVGLTLLAR